MYHSSSSTVIRRPFHSDNSPSHGSSDNAGDSSGKETTLDDFYSDVIQQDSEINEHINSTSLGARLMMSPAVEEVYDLDDDFSECDQLNSPNDFRERSSSAFRRRVTGEDSGQSQPCSNRFNSYGGFSREEERHVSPYATNSQTPKHCNVSHTTSKHLTWNRLNVALFVGGALLSASTSVPITLVPTMARSLVGNADDEWTYSSYYGGGGYYSSTATLEVYDESGTRKRWIPFRIRTRNSSNAQNDNLSSASSFASHLAAVVTLATAFGKFINGPLVDIAGARRLLVVYGVCTSLAIFGLQHSYSPRAAVFCCAAAEFFSSVSWPCCIVILGAHYGTNDATNNDCTNTDGRFERGIYITSIASRCGSLLAMPLSSLLLKWTDLTWRDTAGFASLVSFMGVAVLYFFVTDSPGKVHFPLNPIRVSPPSTYQPWTPKTSLSQRAVAFCSSAYYTVLPSLKTVVISRVFWFVAIAHSGAYMVKSSERILSTYYRDTSFGEIAEGKAGAMSVFLSLGMLVSHCIVCRCMFYHCRLLTFFGYQGGLVFGGKAFAQSADVERSEPHNNTQTSRNDRSEVQGEPFDATQLRPKNMIAFFYCLSICMCYILSFLAVPLIRRALHLPVLVLILQVLATFGLGAGVAVQYYHLPAIVGATFEQNRGLYCAYTDGVAALISSMVWRLVGGAVSEGNPEGGGWAYGWAAVALLLIVCGTFMVGIMEVYFVGGGWRHLNTHKDHGNDDCFPRDVLTDLNGSWMEDEIRSTGLSLEDSSFRRYSGINILSTSAIEFLSPARRERKSLLTTSANPHNQEEATRSRQEDLLGIDDDGSLLYPMTKDITVAVYPEQHINTQTEPLDFAPIVDATHKKAGTDVSDDYISFSGMLDPSKKCHITFTNSEDGGSAIRECSTFDDPYSSLENVVSSGAERAGQQSRGCRGAKTSVNAK